MSNLKLSGDIYLPKAIQGKSAYEIALMNGFQGTEEEWLETLKGENAYEMAVLKGYEGTEEEWFASLKGDKGDKGDTGDPIKISSVTESTAESGVNVVTFSDGSTLRVRNGAKGEQGEYGNPEALRRYGETEKGETVRLENVLPDPYKVKVTARSKNILPYPYMMASGVVNGITYTVNGDGSVTANGTATENAIFTFFVKSADKPLHFLSKGTYTLSCTQIEGARFMYGPVNNGVRDWVIVPFEGATVTLTDTYFIRNLYVEITKGTTVNNFTFYPQVEEGSTATEWSPYIDITAVKSRNLIPYPYNETTKTVNGITFSVHNDGRIAVKGTATAQCVMKLVGSELALPNGTYYLSGCNSDASQTKGKFSLGLKENGSVEYIGVTASGYKFTITDTVKFEALYIEVLSGSIVDNLVVFPMLNYGDVALPFEKYFEPRALKITASGKNLIPYPYRDTTRAVNGITFTDNGDGSITVNGTATDRANFTLANGTQNNPIVPPGQTYTLSGTPKGDNNNCRIQFWDYGGDTQGNGLAFNFTNAKNWDHNIAISVFKGFTANNMVFYPQLELGAVKTEYEPYKAGEELAFAQADEVLDFSSISPNMTLLPDASNVVLTAVYNDTNAAFEKLREDIGHIAEELDVVKGIVGDAPQDIEELQSDVSTLEEKVLNLERLTGDHRNIYVTTETALNSVLPAVSSGSIICVVEETT